MAIVDEETHAHHGITLCEFPTCEGCGGCTEDGGHRRAGRVLCGNCGEAAADAAVDEREAAR